MNKFGYNLDRKMCKLLKKGIIENKEEFELFLDYCNDVSSGGYSSDIASIKLKKGEIEIEYFYDLHEETDYDVLFPIRIAFCEFMITDHYYFQDYEDFKKNAGKIDYDKLYLEYEE